MSGNRNRYSPVASSWPTAAKAAHAKRLAELEARYSAGYLAGLEVGAHRMLRRVIRWAIAGGLTAGTLAYAAHALGWLV